MTSDTLAGQALRSVKWTYPAMFVNAALQVAVVAVLARLVAPSAFGLVAMASLALRFAQYFAQMGVGQAVVQRKTVTPEHQAAGWWASVLIGAAFWVIVVFVSPAVAWVFHEPQLVGVLQVMGAVFFLGGTSTVAFGLLRRDMRFRVIAVTEVATYAFGYAAIGIAVALAGGGVWSLVVAGLAQAATLSIVYNAVARPRMKPVLRWREYRELLGFGSTVSVVSFLEFVNANLDTMVVGRVAGAAPLGVYSRALNLTGVPMQYMSTSMSKVLMPSFARIQDEPERVGRAHVAVLTVFCGLGLPMAIGMAGAAPELVHVLLGPQWLDAIPVLRIVAIGSCAAMLSHFVGVAFEATAHLRDKLIIRGVQLVLFTLLLVALARFGLSGFALAFAISEMAVHIALTTRASFLFGVTAQDLRRAYWPGVLGGAACGAAIVVESQVGARAGLPAIAVLALEVCTGSIVLVTVGMRAGQGRLYRVLSERLGGPGASSHTLRALGVIGRLSAQGGTVQRSAE